jgi:hypothetical protein
MYQFGQKMCLPTFWGLFSQTNPVTLLQVDLSANVESPVFKVHRAEPVEVRPRVEAPASGVQTTEIVYGTDTNGETKIDVVVLESGKSGTYLEPILRSRDTPALQKFTTIFGLHN